MSLTSEMTALADAIREKSKKTEKMNISAMTAAVQSIQTGSGGGGSSFVEPIEKDVNFYDYDGTRLYSYTTEEAAALTELPTPQIDHDGLTFQEWNWTLDEIKAAGVADAGANYITTDGKTRLYITIDSVLRPDIVLNFWQNAVSAVTVDWGDGSNTETPSNSGNVNVSHTYDSPGNYVISLTVSSDPTVYLGNDPDGRQVIDGPVVASLSPDSIVENAYSNQLRKIELGSGVKGFFTSSVAYCMNLDSISISHAVNLGYGKTLYKNMIKFVAFPRTITTTYFGTLYMSGIRRISFGSRIASLAPSLMVGCKNLSSIRIGNKVKEISSCLESASSLMYVYCAGDIRTVNSYAFKDCYSLKKLDLSNCTAVPALSSTNAFQNCPSDMEIIVPASLLDEWKTATNWSVYAGNIKAKEA